MFPSANLPTAGCGIGIPWAFPIRKAWLELRHRGEGTSGSMRSGEDAGCGHTLQMRSCFLKMKNLIRSLGSLQLALLCRISQCLQPLLTKAGLAWGQSFQNRTLNLLLIECDMQGWTLSHYHPAFPHINKPSGKYTKSILNQICFWYINVYICVLSSSSIIFMDDKIMTFIELKIKYLGLIFHSLQVRFMRH